MTDGLKILLTADIHLGNETPLLPAAVRKNTFKKISSLAREHDLLLIAGDLVDNPGVSEEMLDLIRKEFQAIRAAGTEIVLSPGGGEVLDNGVVADIVSDLGCSAVFENSVYSEPFRIKRHGQEVYIYGRPTPVSLEGLKVHRESEEGFHIGLYYLDFSLEKNRSLLAGSAIDFFALGSMHSFRMFKMHGRIIGVYPGSPEALDLTETGERYVVSMKILDNSIESIKRLSVNSVRVRNETVDCSAYGEVETLIEDLTRNASKREFLNLQLMGDRGFPLSEQALERIRKVLHDLHVEDKTLPTLNSYCEEYGAEESIRGEAFRILRERLEGKEGDEEFPLYEIRMILKNMLESGIEAVEDWLCDMSNV